MSRRIEALGVLEDISALDAAQADETVRWMVRALVRGVEGGVRL